MGPTQASTRTRKWRDLKQKNAVSEISRAQRTQTLTKRKLYKDVYTSGSNGIFVGLQAKTLCNGGIVSDYNLLCGFGY